MGNQTQVQVLNEAQLKKFLVVPKRLNSLRDRAFFSVMACGGLRIAEACGLTRENVEDSGDKLRLMFTGKGKKTRTVTLPDEAAVTLRKYITTLPESQVYLFRGHDPKRPLSTRGGRWLVDQRAREIGLPEWFHPHSLRHTFATMLVRRTDLYTTQRVLGHSHPSTTIKHYLAWVTTDADRAAAAMTGAFA